MSLGQETVLLGYPWLRQENPDINWRTQMLTWRVDEPYCIKSIGPETIKDIHDNSQLFALEEKKAKLKPANEIVPKEFHNYLKTVFSE